MKYAQTFLKSFVTFVNPGKNFVTSISDLDKFDTSMMNELVNRFEEGPIVLFIGQKYLSLGGNEDFLLKRTLQKFDLLPQHNEELSYSMIINSNLASDSEKVLAWMDALCKNISTPSWLDSIANLPWSSIYTSAFDNILERAFVNEWRTLQPITDEKFRVIDPRNKLNLHVTYLLGSINESEELKRPPLNRRESLKRKFTTNNLLSRLPEIVTPRGLLIIEGFDISDQVSIEQLASVLMQLGKSQVIICSASNELITNDYIIELTESKKVFIFKDSFASIYWDWQTKGLLTISVPTEFDYLGKWITIQDKRLKIPQTLLSRISRTATILDDSIFFGEFSEETEDIISDFGQFLSSSSSLPIWSGFPRDFAFRREFYDILKKEIITRLKSSDFKEIPIIIHGQSSSGKTTMLGLLAYEIRKEYKCPVIFIEKRYQKVDELEIDFFIQWTEENDSKNTLIIWDGMVDLEVYYYLLGKLNARGRNAIVVGSCYTSSKIPEHQSNYILSPIDLSQTEKKQFIDFLGNIDPGLLALISEIGHANLLAMLYRYLPNTRTGIRQGLASEKNFFAKIIQEQAFTSTPVEKGQLYEGLKAAGIINDESIIHLNGSVEIDHEVTSVVDQMIFSVMVPGRYGLNVPFELLLRIIGFDAFSSEVFKSLNEVKIIQWFENSQGDFLLGPRTGIEAEILSNYLGSRNAEVEYIKLLLRNVRATDFGQFATSSDPQIQFAVELLNKIGPNSNERFKDYFFDLANELRDLRESGFANHPRLILKEASFLREIAKDSSINVPQPTIEILNRAEEIVRNVLKELRGYKERTITTYLKVELAATLGTKIVYFINEANFAEARETYEDIKEILNHSFASNPENYKALDVLAWSTEELIKKDAVKGQERLDAESNLLNLFEIAEIEGISDQNIGEFNRRKLSFYELIGKQELADETFDYLKSHGYASGFYLRAKKILGQHSVSSRSQITEAELKNSKNAYEYLNENFQSIERDGKSVFLLFKCWWIFKTRLHFFEREKVAIPFTKKDWEYCLYLLDLLLSKGEIYSTATIYYLKGISEFHLGGLKQSQDTFRFLDQETSFSSYGSRRIAKTYLASNPDGSPKYFSGTVKRSVSLAKSNKVGDIFVSELRIFVPFLLYEFNKSSYQEGEKISNFLIGFNFRGPIAVPVKN
jgi:hypothetical protein